MSEIKQQLTVDQAADIATATLANGLFIKDSYEQHEYLEGHHKGFKSGAEWQREQDQALLQEAQEIINVFIGNTKTGGYRDYLTEFNIKLLTHLKKLS